VIDWSLARRVARLAAGNAPAEPLPGDLDALARDAEQRVVAYTELIPGATLPPPEQVNRAEWADINLRGLRVVLDPVAERLQPKGGGALAGPLRGAAGGLLAVEVGGLTGLLAQRVLGQYELVLLDPDSPTRLLLLAPNLIEAARKLDVDLDQLLAWVAFHEVTHAVQFTAVPWLREHLAGMLRELLETVDIDVDLKSLRIPSREDIERLREAFREGGLVMLVAGRERKAVLDRLQATMAVIEGHAEHVMDAVGRDALPDLDGLRRALDRRRADRSGMWRLLERVLGLELKMRQYEVGKRFCDAVVARGGIEALNEAFASPDSLPTWSELDRPDVWLARVRPAA
jgi:coenzyme F420 biosynthesis associated uncharacterized protein